MENGPGRPPDVSDKEILQVFEQSGDPVLTASEVADQLDIGRRGLLSRLDQLESEGFLKSKKVGSRSTVWWYPGNTSTKPVEPHR
ncbi:winged helix-turn-helix transcriptional regulator [Halobacterium sp. KA-4]|uniref:winged helix-turn-helix transcriptional regulator n=1 Tax=Halobacterium sp. KA-4 TaxID=2896367 RepID=UPI001E3257D1|nr:winged helix-turn-helix transcriptional regulator [Halobacterium sp. KA-4]MCD2200800.1 winged helix-turn-helix transcriptional regulator [Halobacterium sp. KA-4]